MNEKMEDFALGLAAFRSFAEQLIEQASDVLDPVVMQHAKDELSSIFGDAFAYATQIEQKETAEQEIFAEEAAKRSLFVRLFTLLNQLDTMFKKELASFARRAFLDKAQSFLLSIVAGALPGIQAKAINLLLNTVSHLIKKVK